MEGEKIKEKGEGSREKKKEDYGIIYLNQYYSTEYNYSIYTSCTSFHIFLQAQYICITDDNIL